MNRLIPYTHVAEKTGSEIPTAEAPPTLRNKGSQPLTKPLIPGFQCQDERSP